MTTKNAKDILDSIGCVKHRKGSYIMLKVKDVKELLSDLLEAREELEKEQ